MAVTDDIREELADWLGAQDFARTVRTITDDAATEVRVDVEVLTDMLLPSPVIARIRAETLRDAGRDIRSLDAADAALAGRYAWDDAGFWLFRRAEAIEASIRSESGGD